MVMRLDGTHLLSLVMVFNNSAIYVDKIKCQVCHIKSTLVHIYSETCLNGGAYTFY